MLITPDTRFAAYLLAMKDGVILGKLDTVRTVTKTALQHVSYDSLHWAEGTPPEFKNDPLLNAELGIVDAVADE